MRAAAQTVSYEVFMGLSVMGIVLLTGTFNLREIVLAQSDGWLIKSQFVGFFVFLGFKNLTMTVNCIALPKRQSLS